ncbi:MAG: FAD-dependent oxidoreductase [Bdellovibrionota bacterium]
MPTKETLADLLSQKRPEDRLENKFSDFKKPLNHTEAEIEAHRCINCYDAPCTHACPTSIDIPKFIRRIASGDVTGAAGTILESNILGLSCAHACPTEVLCEGVCVLKTLSKTPIMIGRLQRYAVEQAYEKGTRFFHAGKPTGKHVALVGSGPASLSCAHELKRLGHDVTIFEKSSLPGGLNTQGIAPYKMKADVSLREIEHTASIGLTFEYEKELGKNLSLQELVDKYDAVFLGMGLGADNSPKIAGLDSPQIQARTHGVVDFISKLKTKTQKDMEWLQNCHTVIVVGGGNTALDACRELKALGVPRVILSYRRSMDEMPGYTHELLHARQEGVECFFNTLPVRIAMADQALKVTLGKTATAANGQVTFLPVSQAEEPETLHADIVLLATGQSTHEKILAGFPGLKFEKNRLVVNHETGQTGHLKIFAGGDLTNGGMEVVNAVAEGKKTAIGIHKAIEGELSNGAK